MNGHEQDIPAAFRLALQSYCARVRLARATDLAQSGRFLEAEGLLVHKGELPQDVRELDLLARIAARQGRFESARLRWNTALQIEPENQVFRSCIEQLTPLSRLRRWVACKGDAVLTFVVWVTAAAAIGVLVYVIGTA